MQIPRFIESTLGRLDVRRRFLPDRRVKSLLYSAGGYSPGENAGGRARRTWPPEVALFSRPATFLCFFSAERPGLFCRTRVTGSRGSIDISAYINSRFSEGELSLYGTILLYFFFLRFSCVSHAFLEAKTTENFQQETFYPLNANLDTHIKTSPLRMRENTKTRSVNVRGTSSLITLYARRKGRRNILKFFHPLCIRS